jgi:hypothetical protein
MRKLFAAFVSMLHRRAGHAVRVKKQAASIEAEGSWLV